MLLSGWEQAGGIDCDLVTLGQARRSTPSISSNPMFRFESALKRQTSAWEPLREPELMCVAYSPMHTCAPSGTFGFSGPTP